MTSGPVLRDQGHQQVLEHSSEWWVSCCRTALGVLARSGRPFTMEDVRACGVPDPHSANAWGAVARAAARADLIRPLGFVEARRPEARGRSLRQWIGTQADAA